MRLKERFSQRKLTNMKKIGIIAFTEHAFVKHCYAINFEKNRNITLQDTKIKVRSNRKMVTLTTFKITLIT